MVCSSVNYAAPLIGLIPLAAGLIGLADRRSWAGAGLHRWSEIAKIAGLVLVGLWFAISGLVTLAEDSCPMPAWSAWMLQVLQAGLGTGHVGQLLLFLIAIGLAAELLVAGVLIAFDWGDAGNRGAQALAGSSWWRMVSIGNRAPSPGGVRRMGGLMGLLGLVLLVGSVSSLLRMFRA